MNAIEIINLTKRYQNNIAVNSINLEISQGQLISLLGVNGAGKTTLIKMLSCLTKPSAGDAKILGKSILKNPQEVKEIINISPQETAIAPNLTVQENLMLIASIYPSTEKNPKLKVESTLHSLGLTGIKNVKTKTLSGGWQRRLSIAMALISEPKVLFLDEPTLGLDVLARRELWTLINSLKQKMTIILTTHYMEEAEALSDQISIMVKGEIKATGTAKSLISQTKTKNFEDAFVAIATKPEVKK